MSKQNPATQLMEVANRIRDMRELLGYSMQKMAELTDVSEDSYKMYESGVIDLPFTFLHKCAKVFGVEITVLLEPQRQAVRLYRYPQGQGSGHRQ